MRTQIAIPRIPYIMFELIALIRDREGGITPVQAATVYLAVMPESINYRVSSRDNVTQIQRDIAVTKWYPSPERCTLSGTFGGDTPRLYAGTLMTGWDRLVQFRELIIKISKTPLITVEKLFTELLSGSQIASVAFNQDNIRQKFSGRTQIIPAVNYYDFWFRKFGVINIDSWNIGGNSAQNTQLARYNMDFQIVGDLMKAGLQDDPLLKMLNGMYAEENSYFRTLTDKMTISLNQVTELFGYTTIVDLFNQTAASTIEVLNQSVRMAGILSDRLKEDFIDTFSN